MIVHGASQSPFVRKVLCLLDEKGLSYENRNLLPFEKTDEFLALNPLGKIPIFEDGDFIVPDSSVICAYLEHAHPKPALYPQDAKHLARALWFEEYSDTKLAESILTVFFQRFVRPRFFKEDCDEQLVSKALTEDLPPVFDYLEQSIGGEEFLVGGSFSVADIAICSMFINFRLGDEDVDAERWPGLADYLARVHSRPSFKKALQK